METIYTRQTKEIESYYQSATPLIVFRYYRHKLLNYIFWRNTQSFIGAFIKDNMYEWLHDLPQNLITKKFNVKYKICSSCNQEIVISKEQYKSDGYFLVGGKIVNMKY